MGDFFRVLKRPDFIWWIFSASYLPFACISLAVTLDGSLAGINDNTPFKYDLKEGLSPLKEPLVKPWIPVLLGNTPGFLGNPNFSGTVPILLGVLTPCFFATQVIFVKHLSGDRMKFDSTTLTFSTCGRSCVRYQSYYSGQLVLAKCVSV